MMKPGKNFHRGFHAYRWVRGQEFDAETVNGTEERSIEYFDYLQRKVCFENLFPGALLHLVCRAIGVGDDDQLG